MEKTTTTQSTVYYNGACPVCRGFARRHMQEGSAELRWCDIQAGAGDEHAPGISVADVERRLHLVEADGRVVRGYDAMRRLDELAGRKTTNSRVLRSLQRLNVEFWAWLLYRLNRLRK